MPNTEVSSQLYEFSKEQAKIWNDWVKKRPEAIQKLCERLKPNHLYKLTTTNQLVIVQSFQAPKDGPVTCTVRVPRRLQENGFM